MTLPNYYKLLYSYCGITVEQCHLAAAPLCSVDRVLRDLAATKCTFNKHFSFLYHCFEIERLLLQAGFVPFSMGRRSCIGESFAKLELHMLLTMMLQKFTISPTPGYTVSLKPIDSMVVVPEVQNPLIATRR